MKLQKKYNKRLCTSCHMDDKIINSKISSPYPSELLTFRTNKESWELFKIRLSFRSLITITYIAKYNMILIEI